jgi:hypothetical protein
MTIGQKESEDLDVEGRITVEYILENEDRLLLTGFIYLKDRYVWRALVNTAMNLK